MCNATSQLVVRPQEELRLVVPDNLDGGGGRPLLHLLLVQREHVAHVGGRGGLSLHLRGENSVDINNYVIKLSLVYTVRRPVIR